MSIEHLNATVDKGILDFVSIDDSVFRYYAPLARVKRFVDSHYGDPLSLKTVAGIASLERTYFSTYFREKTGVCYRDWLSSVRVTRALELMALRNLPITDIAFDVGFQDLRTFERAFEKCTGLSPRVMRKRIRVQGMAKLV